MAATPVSPLGFRREHGCPCSLVSVTTNIRLNSSVALACPNRSLCKHTCRACISRTSSNICTRLVTGLLMAVCLPRMLVLGLLLISLCSQHCTGCEHSWGHWAAIGTELARKPFGRGSRHQTKTLGRGHLGPSRVELWDRGGERRR